MQDLLHDGFAMGRVCFSYLRKWETRREADDYVAYTEQIYVHSKLMIVDDSMIIGMAGPFPPDTNARA